jgi:elongation factor 1-gamma
VWLYPIYGLMEVNQTATNKAKGDIRKVLEILNQHLNDQTYLVGERITLADVVVALHLTSLFQRVLDSGFRKPFTNVVRWFTTLINQPNFKEVLGEVTLATKMEQAKPSEHAPKEEKPKAEPKSKQEKPKEEKPKVEKPKPKKEEEDDGEEKEDIGEKPKNPLDLLPKSTFDLETWKRTYSNKDGKESIVWFWENLDVAGWSLWKADYKYNNELDSLLRTCNLIGGWFQRLDRLRKYGFGNAMIFKNGDTYEISSIWLVRGQELPAEILLCDDTELYEWTKLNPEDAATKKTVQEYWNWEGDFGGKVFEQGKVYK